jgi:hypothetical protein
MVSAQATLLTQAKQGDAKAIVVLLNQKLQPKGITAKASVKHNCLHVMMESATSLHSRDCRDFALQ